MARWADSVETIKHLAELDIRRKGAARLQLVAADGDDPLVHATSRSYPKGEYGDPIIELVALALPLGADRLAVGVTCRAWSMADPIAPVVPGVGDLRQQVLMIWLCEPTGRRGRAVVTTVMLPFTYRRADDAIVWQAERRMSAAGQGWLPQALPVLVDNRKRVPPEQPGEGFTPLDQFIRCQRLGHQLNVTPEGERRLRAYAPIRV